MSSRAQTVRGRGKMNQGQDNQFGHHPSQQAYGEFLPVYQLSYEYDARTLVDYQISTLDGPVPSDAVYSGGPLRQHVTTAEDGPYVAPSYPDDMLPETPCLADPAAELQSRWAPVTPITPVGGDRLGYFDIPGSVGPPYYPDSGTTSPTVATAGTAAGPFWSGYPVSMDHTYQGIPAGHLAPHIGPQAPPAVNGFTHQGGGYDGSLPEEAGSGAEGGTAAYAKDNRTPNDHAEPEQEHKEWKYSSTSRASGARKKSSRKKSPSNHNSRGQTPLLGPLLRTATRKYVRNEPPHKPGESPEELRARASHNQVEKEYRTRLQWQFEQLLEVLPGEGMGVDDEGEVPAGAARQRRLSKAEVLDKATRHIRFLEDDKARLRREKRELEAALEKAAH